MSYKLTSSNGVQRSVDGASLPCRYENGQVVVLDEHSPFVKEFQAWVAAGGTPEPAQQPTRREVILARLSEIDRLTGSVRWVRELAIGTNEILTALRAGPLPDLPPAGTGMTKVQLIEAECQALRAELATL